MAKSPEQVVHKIEPRGEEFLEEVAEGSEMRTNPDAPPEAFHAGMVAEDIVEATIPERTVGPTEPTSPFGTTDELEAEDLPSEDSPVEDEGGKEESSETEARSEMIPRERFDEINDKLKTFEKNSQMLEWIMANPEKFAATVRQETPGGPPPTEAESKNILLEEPALPTGEDLENISDKELFDISVKQQTVRVLNELLPGVFEDLNGLKTFKGTMEELVMKSTLDANQKPIFPRWDELQPTVNQVLQKHPTMDRREAYWMAERMVPGRVEAPLANQAALSASNLSEQVGTPEQGPVGVRPKPATPKAVHAARLVDLGRSSQAYQRGTKPASIREAVELAMADQGFPE